MSDDTPLACQRLPDVFESLSQFALNARASTRPTQIGGHITRRRGQSLEFYDYTPYTPGDDMRFLDWRASVRVHGPQAFNDPSQWLLREFVAEEELRLLISVDTRPTMHYPQVLTRRRRSEGDFNASKLQAALWLAEALTFIAADSKDRVIWQPLFTSSPAPSYAARSLEAAGVPFQDLQAHPADEDAPLNLDAIERHLKPAFVWLVLTDFYFSAEQGEILAERVRSAQAGNRWVILVDLDSWPYEAAQLGDNYYRISGPGIEERQAHKLRTRQGSLSKIHADVDAHKADILADCGTVDFSWWQWPQTLASHSEFVAFFLACFLNDTYMQRLFMRPE
jgi:uncharacterized protein (DUF58 family)